MSTRALAGRPRKSDDEKKARGTYKPSRSSGKENTDILLIDPGEPLFDLSPMARDMWDATIKTMISYGTMTEVDLPAVSMMCVWYDKFLTHCMKPDIELGADNCTKPSGYFKVSMDASEKFMKYAQQLGVLATVRHKMRKPDAAKKHADPMDGYI